VKELKKDEAINPEKLLKEAKAAEHKEAYRLLERNERFRVGVGVRVNTLEETLFFVEVNIKLSEESGEVDLSKLSKTLICLKSLQSIGYLLTYQDGTCVSCEKAKDMQNLTEECTAVMSLLKTSFDCSKDEIAQN